MSDTYSYVFQNSVNDDFCQQKEGNYQDDASAPIVQCESNKQTPFSGNGQNEETQGNPTLQNYQTHQKNINYDNKGDYNINRNRKKIRNVERIHLQKIRIIFAYILVSLSIIDVLLQIIFSCVNVYFMIDDLAVLGFSSIIIYSYYKHKNIINYLMAVLTVIIWFGGFCIKAFGLASSFKINAISSIFISLIFIKTFILFCFIPIICP